MMYPDEQKEALEALAVRAAATEGVGIAWIELKRHGNTWVFRVFIEATDRNVDLGDCERVSRRLSLLLDVEDPIQSSYTLEVSTPGLDRPLHGVEDYRRFEGRLSRVKLLEAIEGRRKLVGRLAGVEGDSLLLRDDADGSVTRLPLTLIEQARLEVELDVSGPTEGRA